MEVTFKHGITYSNRNNIPINEIAESLLGNETLIINAGQFIGNAVSGLCVERIDVKFSQATHSSPLRELFLGTLIFTFQEELNKEVPELITALTGMPVSDKYDTLLTVGVLIFGFYGADYLYRRYVSDKPSPTITENQDKLYYIAGDFLNIGQDALREAADNTASGTKKQSIAKAAKRLILPAKREQEAIITTDSGIEIPRNFINEFPSDVDLEGEEDDLISEAYQSVEIEIRAEDKDRNKQGWAGVIESLHDKRLKMEVYPDIDPAKIFGKEKITGDIVLVSKKQPNETYLPKMFHLVRLHDNS